MVPTSYERVSTMGTATLWKMLMLAWSYHRGLAIPAKNSKRPFVGGLSRLVKTGYSTNVLKLDFSSLYPSIQLVHDVFPECDITHAMKGMLKYFRDTRIKI
jgi:DNA polymerase elongation subunit (family B)